MRMENERLRTELKLHKNEIVGLRNEKDSLVKTIEKLDAELTSIDYQRNSSQMPKRWSVFFFEHTFW